MWNRQKQFFPSHLVRIAIDETVSTILQEVLRTGAKVISFVVTTNALFTRNLSLGYKDFCPLDMHHESFFKEVRIETRFTIVVWIFFYLSC